MDQDKRAEMALLYELSRRPPGFGVAQLWVFQDWRPFGLYRSELRAAAKRLGLEVCTKESTPSLLWWRYPANVIPFVPPDHSRLYEKAA
jgi:hypothetical protein